MDRSKTQLVSSEPQRTSRYIDKYSQHSCIDSRREKKHIIPSGVEVEGWGDFLSWSMQRRGLYFLPRQQDPPKTDKNTNHLSRFHVLYCFFGYTNRIILANLGQKLSIWNAFDVSQNTRNVWRTELGQKLITWVRRVYPRHYKVNFCKEDWQGSGETWMGSDPLVAMIWVTRMAAWCHYCHSSAFVEYVGLAWKGCQEQSYHPLGTSSPPSCSLNRNRS